MLLLVAVNAPHGPTSADFADTTDGEPVIPAVFELGAGGVDRWNRAWVGLTTNGTTSTARVVDRPDLDPDHLRRQIDSWLHRAGWVDALRSATERGECLVDGEVLDDPARAAGDVVDEQIAVIGRLTRTYSAGAVLSRFGDLVASRWPRRVV